MVSNDFRWLPIVFYDFPLFSGHITYIFCKIWVPIGPNRPLSAYRRGGRLDESGWSLRVGVESYAARHGSNLKMEPGIYEITTHLESFCQISTSRGQVCSKNSIMSVYSGLGNQILHKKSCHVHVLWFEKCRLTEAIRWFQAEIAILLAAFLSCW